MLIFTQRQGALVCFWLSVLFVVANFCYGDHSTVEVVGLGECADCKQNNIKTAKAFSGLRVTVDCKAASGDFETRGVGELDGNGNFRVSLPHDIVKAGELKEECYAQLHSASATPCPAHDGLYNTKIVIKSKVDGKHTLGPAGKLKFSSVTCPSAFFWPIHKHPVIFHKHPHYYPPFPISKEPPPPTYVPISPPVPNKPCPPVVKPPVIPPPLPPKVKPPIIPSPPKVKPPPVPPKVKPPTIPSPPKVKPPPVPPKVKPPIIPCPPKVTPPPTPPVPIIKPCPPIVLPPIPIKPLPPLPPFKPLPPLPKCPPLPFPPKFPPKNFFHHHPFGKWPPLPPKNFFHHPKYGKWPPAPPFSPHP